MPLKLSLRSGEKLVVNGVVLEVSGKRNHVSIGIHNQGHILRENQILREEDANTPVRRAQWAVQAMILDYGNADSHRDLAVRRLAELRSVFMNPDVIRLLDEADGALSQDRAYLALSRLRRMEGYESLLLKHAELSAAAPASVV